MSATDWYMCPKCKVKAIKYIDSWYGKVDMKAWEVLAKFREAWNTESESFKPPKDYHKVFDTITDKFEDFDESEFFMEESIITLRYDSDTGITDDGILDMTESYECQCCDFKIIVDKKWVSGTNQEAK